MIVAEERFKNYLKQKGLKFTPERQLILEEVLSLHKHFEVEDIFIRLREKGNHISRATIYRTFPLLVESGLIKEAIPSQGGIRFEHIYGHKHHDHLVCLKCGKIIEFKEDRIERLQDAICKRYDFIPVEHKLGIRGYCKKCR